MTHLIFKSIKVALLVGSLLVLINQSGAILGDHEFRWIPALLTYCVPFCVFLAGQLSAQNAKRNQVRRKPLIEQTIKYK